MARSNDREADTTSGHQETKSVGGTPRNELYQRDTIMRLPEGDSFGDTQETVNNGEASRKPGVERIHHKPIKEGCRRSAEARVLNT